jgi:predicted glutamine amidotransferase
LKAKRAVYYDRRAESASESRDLYAKAVERTEKSPSSIVIGHLRKATYGNTALVNTHPFHYHDWVFGHNGSIYNVNTLPLVDRQPFGTTDSERFLYWLVDQIRHSMDATSSIISHIQEWRSHLIYSSLTFVLSDGETLWAYRDIGDKALEKGESVEERFKYYTLFWTLVNQTPVVCSEPLPGVSPHWEEIQDKQLFVFKLGSLKPDIYTI